jgi:hypothetical protein
LGYKVDLTGVEVKTFEPVPAGRYYAKVSDMVYNPASKRSQKPKVQFTFTITGAADETTGKSVEAAGVDLTNRKAFYEVSLQDQSLWNLKRTLLALGDSAEDLEGELDLEKEDYVDRDCILVLAVEEYEGTPRQRTRRVEPLK